MESKQRQVIKVCHVTTVHSRYDPRIFSKECKSLSNSGYEVTLIVNDVLPDESVDGIRLVSTHLNPRNRFDRMVKTKRKIRKLMKQTDARVYHFHDPELLSEACWIKKKGKAVIFDFHEDVSKQILFKIWIPAPMRKLVSYVYRVYERSGASRFDALVSVTPKIVERLRKSNENTIMITNFPVVREETGNDFSQKKRAVCFAGEISAQWNHDKIIRAIASIEDIVYILAGKSHPTYIEKLKSLDGWEKVEYLGRLPFKKVIEIYDESMIGMTLLNYDNQVSDEGTLGNTKLFEFMQAGLPVICSDNKIWKEIVEENNCGLAIYPDDVEEIKKAILYFLDNIDAARQMGENGLKAVKDKYNWSTQEVKLVKLYDSVVSVPEKVK
ncbi:MAG: glycosyltransferase family 4 protein [Eubacteriales bacterium]|nr:glycosyltransferase family 4 protein [Eubacteriales bacterium]MDD4327181.1 glycosyltransferase family 4 protein [Eubacteriales bacterium]MDD4717067.1 glycosyltransferase family 4 protein [Eubacteriales bacterium]